MPRAEGTPRSARLAAGAVSGRYPSPLIALVTSGFAVAAPAAAADPAAALTINKTVDHAETRSVDPGGEFSYSIVVGCDDGDCVNAQMTDPLPAQFDGFAILATTVSPGTQPSSQTYTGCTTTVTANCLLTVDFKQDLGGGTVGLKAGGTYTVSVTLKAPDNLSPSWPYNGVPVVNTAMATATTANTVTDGATVTVNIPITADIAVGKTWTPANQQFQPGAPSSIALTTQNTSNVPATALVAQDPTSAVDGASALGTDNPFNLVDFDSFGDVTLPAGATTVQVDAYTLDPVSNTYKWVPGQPRAPGDIDLPAGVAAGDVAGLRFTYQGDSGATIAAGGAAGSVGLNVVQRATNRTTGASLITGATVTNIVTGTVAVPGAAPVSKAAQAPFTIGPLTVAVDAAKSISPSKIPAGTTAKATISGKNASNGPLDSLSISDLDYFTATLQFGGFTAGIGFPVGATAGSITWHFSDGSTVTEPFADGAEPVAPAAPAGAHLTGFVLEFTGAIESGQSTTAQFDIAPTGDYVSKGESPAATTNTVAVHGVNSAGSADDTADAQLQVFFPDISLVLSKQISPSAAVAPGGTVVAQLPTTTGTDSAYVKPTTITVDDVWRTGEPKDFWNAFNPVAIAPTQVPANSSLTVSYTTDQGATWQVLATAPAADATQSFSYDIPPALAPTITGLRYTFENPAGFAQGTSVSPNTVFQARADLRDGGEPTSTPDAGPSSYENRADAVGEGSVAGVPSVKSDPVHALANASIETHTGEGTLLASKSWRTPNFQSPLTTLNSQSGAQAGTLLGWGVTTTGFSSLTVTDPSGDYTDPAQTVFQAFNLNAIAPRTFTDDPLLKWDAVQSVALFENGTWTTIAPPSGGWMGPNGFVGYTLSGAESAATTGVQITVIPNDAARTASTDPLRPPAGSGIATSAANSNRQFGLLWTLRNTVRDSTAVGSSPWVTATRGYNLLPSLNSIRNTVAVTGVQNGVQVSPANAHADISLIDNPPLVDVAKTSQKSTIVVPKPGDVDPTVYPTNDFTVTARNQSLSRASYLRVSDPMPCDDGNTSACVTPPTGWNTNPYASATYSSVTNPFERFTLTGLTFAVNTAQVSRDASIVTLWHRSAAGVLSTSTLSITAAQQLQAAALLDVVGVSVLYQAADPATNGGSIVNGTALTMTMHTQLRKNLRSDDSVAVTPIQVDNHTFSQSYDPVLYPSGQQSTPSDTANATVTLTKGTLDVTAAKTFTPSTLLEKDRANPVAVALTATPGNATVATNEVTVTDTDQGFWNTFRLTGLAAGDVTLPAGSDQVRVDVQQDGDGAWVEGATGPTAVLPDVPAESITGIRFVFSRADGGIFSHSALPAGWTATAVLHVQLLDANRQTGEAIPFPSTVDDTIQTLSHRTDDPQIYPDATKNATATMKLEPGTFSLDVVKSVQDDVHTVTPGDPLAWTLTFTNTGTGFLTIANLVDSLPASLQWDGLDPTFSTSPGGLLSTDVTTAFDKGTNALTFTWPSGAQRMAPGEKFTVGLGITLLPGLTGDQRATNTFVVETAQTLASCTNTSGNQQGTVSGLPATQCGTTNYVQPTPGPGLFTRKGVKGDVIDSIVSGAVNVNNPKGPCLVDSDGYYVSPCAANTVVGGTDQWKLDAINSGTIAYKSLTLVDPLPFRGDRLLATGSARGSTYTPIFDKDYGINFDAPAGTAITWQVTTAADVCVGSSPTDSAWPNDPKCATHPVAAQWTDGTAFTGDWSAVTGIRILMDFSALPGGELKPGGAVSAVYRTVNTPATTTQPNRAPVTVPVANAFAWNQFGAAADLTNGRVLSRAPVKAGVTLPSGSLQVTKALTGPAADLAPDEFQADVACTIAGADVDLGDSATLTLKRDSDFTARIDGIPLGADCTISEHGDPGSYGEFSRDVTPSQVRILQASSGTVVPDEQQVTITNDYQFGQLTIGKVADHTQIQTGGTVTYTVTVANTGKLVAKDFDVTDTLPSGASVVRVSDGGTVTDGVVTWRIVELKPGDSVDLHVTVRFDKAGDTVNRAEVENPPGTWKPPIPEEPCASGDGACAPVSVTDPPSGGLPNTGSSVGGLVGLGALLLAAGLGLWIATRRRRML